MPGIGSTKPLLARRWGFVLALLLAISFPLFAAAEESSVSSPETTDASADLGEIEVSGVHENESALAPGAFTSIIEPERFDRRTRTAAEVLSETAGVDVTTLGGEGSLSTVSIRGSSAEQVAVFVDGVRINSALSGSVDFATIPVESIERIEVIRGAASARFGTDAIGGVINIVTKRASGKRAIEAKLTGASFSTLHTSESWLEPHPTWDLTLAHEHQSSAGDFTFTSAGVTMNGSTIANPQTYTRMNNRFISEDVLVKGGTDLGDGVNLNASNDFFWTTRQVPGTEIETTLLYPNNPLEANEEIFRTTTAALINATTLPIKGLTLQGGATLSMNHDHFTDPSPAIGDPIDVTSLALAPEAFAEATHTAALKPLTITSVLRGQYRYDHSSNTSPYPGAQLMGSHGRSTVAAFLEESFSFFTDRLLVVPSGRVESASDRSVRASWRVGLIAKPWTFLNFKANVGTAFRYPSFSELYYPDQGYLRGNPNLDDEESFSYDAGLEFTHKRARLEVAYFRNRIDNQILFVPISATTIQPINTGRVNAQGVEVTASAEPLEWLKLNANYTWTDAKFASNGLRLPGRPQHKVNARAQLSYRWASIFGEVQYVGSYPLGTANTVFISSHTAANVGTTITFAKHFFGTLEVKDVTNVQIYDARGFPLPRRSYWVTVGAKS